MWGSVKLIWGDVYAGLLKKNLAKNYLVVISIGERTSLSI